VIITISLCTAMLITIVKKFVDELFEQILALLHSSEMQKMPQHMRDTFHSMWGIGKSRDSLLKGKT